MKSTARAPLFAAMSFVLAATFIGCSDDAKTFAPTSSAGTTPPSSSSALAVPSGGVGVPACDGYIAKMRTCIDKLPEADRAAKKEVLEKTLGAWRQEAQRPEMQKNLETTCKAAAAALESDPLCK